MPFLELLVDSGAAPSGRQKISSAAARLHFFCKIKRNVDKCRFACVVCRNCEFESEERSVGSLVYASHPFDFAKKCSLAAAEDIFCRPDGAAPKSTSNSRNGI